MSNWTKCQFVRKYISVGSHRWNTWNGVVDQVPIYKYGIHCIVCIYLPLFWFHYWFKVGMMDMLFTTYCSLATGLLHQFHGTFSTVLQAQWYSLMPQQFDLPPSAIHCHFPRCNRWTQGMEPQLPGCHGGSQRLLWVSWTYKETRHLLLSNHLSQLLLSNIGEIRSKSLKD